MKEQRGRGVQVDFSAGQVSSDGGGLLLRQADKRILLTQRLSACFTDHREQSKVEHELEELIAQRVYGLSLGYEDLNDHERLSRDSLIGTLIGKKDPEGKTRRQRKDQGKGSASPSTLGRVERTKVDATAHSRYAKVVADFDAMRDVFVKTFIEHFERAPERLILDIDPTDIELYGEQEARFYHGHYGHYCYLPMYLFCGEYPLCVKLRPSNIDGAKGVVQLLKPVIEQIRKAFPDVHIIVRADSGFCREELMAYCETSGIDYVLGIARNARLQKAIQTQMHSAFREHLQTGKPARRFRHFHYRTLKNTWSQKRRVIGKAEYLGKGENPRFIVTSLSAKNFEARYLYEEVYCARGEMENRIKEQQLDLFADRASCHTFRGNEVRLWWAMAAHLLIVTLRHLGLRGTELCKAQAATIRTKLLKIGALVTVSVRRVHIRLSSAFPLQDLFVQALTKLRPAPA
jgi:hypothetical protein